MADALEILIAERDRLNRAIAILQDEPAAPSRGRKPGRPPGSTNKKNAKKGRKAMSPAAKKAVSERMKKYWAARRKGKGKTKS